MRRREFIAAACVACCGTGSLSALLSSCAPENIIEGETREGKIRVPLPFPGEGPVHIVRARDLPYDIALVTEAGGGIHALVLRCTHADNPLTVDGNGFSCSLHGSRFDAAGDVMHGPARRPLERLATAREEGAVVIYADARHPASR